MGKKSHLNKPKKFKIPSDVECYAAIGLTLKRGSGEKRLFSLKHKDLYESPGGLGRLIAVLDPTPFKKINMPRPGDWLDQFPEEPQTFCDYVSELRSKPSWEKDTIYILPLGDFTSEKQKIFCSTLLNYASAFFCMNVQMLPSINIVDNKNMTRRITPFGTTQQFLTSDLLKLIGKELPDSGFCAIGITMEDLYPEESWNFVFGEATSKGTGVFSFARYNPMFYDQPNNESSERLLLERSLKVMVHEIGHMFGMSHCVHYNCIMNGSNGLEEEDASPFHLCPVCLRKLHFSIGFDVFERYRKLKQFFEEQGLAQEAEWTNQWLK